MNPTQLSVRRFRQDSPLAFRLFLSIALFCLLFVLLGASLYLYFHFDALRGRQISEHHLQGLAQAVQGMDHGRVAQLMEEILHQPGVAHVALLGEGQGMEVGRLPAGDALVRRFPLHGDAPGGKSASLGTLEIRTGLASVHGWEGPFPVLVIQAVLLFLFAGLVIILIYRHITRHLAALSAQVRHMDLEHPGEPLRLARAESEPSDELGTLLSAFNGVWTRLGESVARCRTTEDALREAHEVLESRVRERTAALHMEVGERRRVEKALLEQEEVLRAIIESVRDSVLVVDAVGKVIHANRRFASMWQIPGELMHGRDDERLLAFVRDQLADPDAFVRRVHLLYNSRQESLERIRFKDGRIIERFSRPLLRDDRLAGRVWSFFDVTERTLWEQQLIAAKEAAEEANHAKSDFLSTMSHEVRTPINAILGLGELLAQTDMDHQQRAWLEAMRKAGGNLFSLLNNILDFSRIEAGAFALEDGDINLEELLSEVISLFRGAAAEKGIGLVLNADPKALRVVRGDLTRLRQVLANLVGNAVKFTERGEVRLTVSVDTSEGETLSLRFEVADSGIGVAEHVRSRLFSPFIQADASTTRRFGGSGLGLAISRKLVACMGGDIAMWSRENEGSRFWFTLRFKLSATPVVPGDKQGDAQEPKRMLSVLLVEDEPINQMVAAGLLESFGHRVEVAGDGETALALVQKGGFDAVMMDLRMPGMDGMETTRRIRALPVPTHALVPIIGFTADVVKETLEACLAAGMDDMLPKPVDPARLLEMIQRLPSRYVVSPPGTMS